MEEEEAEADKDTNKDTGDVQEETSPQEEGATKNEEDSNQPDREQEEAEGKQESGGDDQEKEAEEKASQTEPHRQTKHWSRSVMSNLRHKQINCCSVDWQGLLCAQVSLSVSDTDCSGNIKRTFWPTVDVCWLIL